MLCCSSDTTAVCMYSSHIYLYEMQFFRVFSVRSPPHFFFPSFCLLPCWTIHRCTDLLRARPLDASSMYCSRVSQPCAPIRGYYGCMGCVYMQDSRSAYPACFFGCIWWKVIFETTTAAESYALLYGFLHIHQNLEVGCEAQPMAWWCYPTTRVKN